MKKKNVDLKSMDNILVPINIKDYHWLVLNIRKPNIYIIDSMQSAHLDGVDILQYFLVDYF